MRNVKVGRVFVIFALLTLVVVLWPFVTNAEEIKLEKENWSIEVMAQHAPNNLPVYLNPKDSKKTWAIVEVPKSPYIEGQSSIVMLGQDKGPSVILLAGLLSAPGNRLVIVKAQIHNKDKTSKSFAVGDINLIGSDGQMLPYAAVAKGKSYFVAKPSIASWKASQEVKATIDSDEKLKIAYAFLIPSKSFPISLQFQKEKINFIMEEEKLPNYKRDSPSSWMEIASKTKIGGLEDAFFVNGSFATEEADVQFSTITLSNGSYLSQIGPGTRLAKTVNIIEKFKGVESSRSLSALYIFGNGHYPAGKITILKSISPSEVVTEYSKGLRAIFQSSFKAEKGDVFAGIGVDDVISVRTTE